MSESVIHYYSACDILESPILYGVLLRRRDFANVCHDLVKNLSSRKHAYIILTPLNPTFI